MSRQLELARSQSGKKDPFRPVVRCRRNLCSGETRNTPQNSGVSEFAVTVYGSIEASGTCRRDHDVQIRSQRLLSVHLVNLGRSNR